MEILETIISYITEMLGGLDFAEIISGITEAIEYIISLVTG